MSDDPKKDELIEALLAQIPFDGWTTRSLRQALVAIGEHPDDGPIYFPGGTGEMIGAFCAWADERMEQTAVAADLAAYRVPQRVKAVIEIRFEQNRPHKEAIRRALAWLALPMNASLAVRMTAATVDAIWYAAGDNSTDFAWYTKRGILAGVYSSTLLYWLRDVSDEDADTFVFLDRRLADVARIGKFRRRLEDRLKGFGGGLRGLLPKRG